MQPLSRDQVREADRLAIEEIGIPGVVLMENAGRTCAEVVLELIDDLRDERLLRGRHARVAVLCGGGNNGGDGYVIARHLYNHGVEVALFAAKDPAELNGDAKTNANITTRMGLSPEFITDKEKLHAQRAAMEEADILVDALLGTGFSGEVRGRLVDVISVCNQLHEQGASVVSVDVPSGLDCDSGEPSNATVEADITVTFVAPKKGFTEQAERYTGRIIVADIGAPPDLVERVLRA